MRFTRTILIGAAASLLVPGATAQSESPLSEGARVRITAPSKAGKSSMRLLSCVFSIVNAPVSDVTSQRCGPP